MSGWFDYDEDKEPVRWDIDKEIWADTFLVLAPRTLLWAFLYQKDLTQDSIDFSLQDLYKAKEVFMNYGYIAVYSHFSVDQLISWLSNFHPYITSNFRNYNANINKLADVNTLSDKEIVFFKYDEQIARNFLLFYSLKIEFYKMHDKLLPILPVWSKFGSISNTHAVSHEEIKQRIKSWKHIPDRYKN